MKQYIVSTEDGDFIIITNNPKLCEQVLNAIQDETIDWFNVTKKNLDKFYDKEDLMNVLCGN